MKFTAERLFEIAKEEYSKAGLEALEGSQEWAFQSESEEYADEEAVREELRGYIEAEKNA